MIPQLRILAAAVHRLSDVWQRTRKMPMLGADYTFASVWSEGRLSMSVIRERRPRNAQPLKRIFGFQLFIGIEKTAFLTANENSGVDGSGPIKARDRSRRLAAVWSGRAPIVLRGCEQSPKAGTWKAELLSGRSKVVC